MRKEYNMFYSQNLHQKNTFLPMLCSKPSIKDVTIPKLDGRSASFSGDPLSPRISCIGQVKRNGRVLAIGLPTSHRNNDNVKYLKLKKLFSSKNLTAVAAAAGGGVRRQAGKNGESLPRRMSCDNKRRDSLVSVVDLDPPLPVIKKAQRGGDEGGETDSLWKRRSGGGELRRLQIQQIQHPSHHLQPTTV